MIKEFYTVVNKTRNPQQKQTKQEGYHGKESKTNLKGV